MFTLYNIMNIIRPLYYNYLNVFYNYFVFFLLYSTYWCSSHCRIGDKCMVGGGFGNNWGNPSAVLSISKNRGVIVTSIPELKHKFG